MMKSFVAVAVGFFAFVAAANAGIVGVDVGTGAPPATLGGYTISALPLDLTPDFTSVGGAPGSPPLSGAITFSPALDAYTVGASWASWSHGYTGRVYYTGSATTATIGLPASTGAFLFYAEPNPFAVWGITATADDGTFVTASVNGSGGANGFGFYGTGGTSLASITVTSGVDFAVGEFYGVRVPEPATLTVLALGALSLLRRRL
ncbi:MAG TPA: PEP-CTERM sorting domain-containing protein [Phycisphaerae bacterium]|nr:PEP-CTERM sorting domain-containing protein [Phycisphaerae bacterium]